jgi:NAD(P)H dehydrogenase (quinone)
MKHAVMVAHPNPRSLTASAGEAYAAAVRALGHEAVVRDLYAMRFDPCLGAEEIPHFDMPSFRSDVVEERALLQHVDVFAFVYPFWFNAPPAILKGYVDRVFSMGFGFGPAIGGTEPLLEGRKLISFSFSGAPDHWVRDTGALTGLVAMFDSHLAQMCGLRLVDHVHTGGIAPDMRSDAVEAVLARVRDAVQACFGSGAEAIRDAT